MDFGISNDTRKRLDQLFRVGGRRGENNGFHFHPTCGVTIGLFAPDFLFLISISTCNLENPAGIFSAFNIASSSSVDLLGKCLRCSFSSSRAPAWGDDLPPNRPIIKSPSR